MGATLGAILAQVVVALLQWGAARADFRARVMAEVEKRGLSGALSAYGWEVRALAAPDGGATLRVLPGAGAVPDITAGPDAQRIPPVLRDDAAGRDP